MKKSFLLFVVAMVATLSVWAQVPQTLTYQAVVRDANGRLICNSNVGVQLSIVQGAEDGTAVYSDRQTVHTNANGLFTMLIGSEENSLGGINWAAGPYYLKSEIDHTGGINYTLATVQQMFSVPYALRAHTVDSIVGGINYNETDPVFSAWDKDYNDLINRPTIPTMVSELTNDAGYLTFFTESQILSISNDTIFLTGGSFVKLPDGFSGDYNDLVNLPTIPTVPTNVSEFINDAGYITSSNIPTNVSELTNDAGYLTSYTEVQTLCNVVALGNAANGQLKEVSDPTEALDAVNLQTLNAVVVSWTHLFDSITSRFDSITHRYDSIMHNVDSIIHYQDSVIDTLSSLLTELSVTAGDTTAVECERFTWYGTEYTVSGDYQHRLTNVAGFDSVLTMHLTINHGTHNSENQAACDSYTWHGNDYTASGTYTYDYTNGLGCASTGTLHLTINVSTAATDTHTECDSYTWIDGNTYIASNSTATHTLANAASCDSVVTLNLTLNNSTHNAETHTVSDSYTWHETTYTESGDYTYLYTNAAGCVSVDTLHLTIDIGVQGFDENGASNAVFTIADGRTVKFSRGNLQYTTTGTHTVTGGGTEAGTWRFAEHQYDYIGEDNANISSSYTGWIDLFGWGTSGWNSGAVAYQPWDTSLVASDYNPGNDYTNNLIGTYARADWGVYNAISNGGNQPGMWRTMTKDEWNYLIFTRNASTVGGTANARYAKATVNGTSGLIIFPNTFTLPAGLTVTNVNISDASYTNTYTASQWSQMEAAGCIFLPAGGERDHRNVNLTGVTGEYLSSTRLQDGHVWYIAFNGDYLHFGGIARGVGRSVRLVRDVGGASTATVTTSTVSNIWHNLPTFYKCYNCFMCRKYPEAHDRIGHIFNRQNANLLWSDYENMLSQMDIVNYVKTYIGKLSKLSEKEIQTVFDTLYDDINSYFHEWVNQIEYQMATTDRLTLDTNAAFLNFNYTNTLERLYEVSPQNICYIHGDTGNNALYRPVIGHGDSSVERINQSKKNEIHKIVCDYGEHPNWTTDLEDFFGVIVMEIEKFITGLKKNTKYYISENQGWFNRLDSLKDICIMGHSLSTIDAPYFTEIRSMAPDAKWHVSYYGEKDKVEKGEKIHAIFGELQKKIDYKLFSLDELKVTK